MKRIIFVVAIFCLCSMPGAYAWPQGKEHKDYHSKNLTRQEVCDKKIAKLQEKRKLALRQNHKERAEQLERRVEKIVRQCAGDEAVRRFREQEDLSKQNTPSQQENRNKKVDELQEDAKEVWSDFMDDMEDSVSYFSKEAEKGGEKLEDELDEILKDFEKIKKKVSERIEEGARSDMAKNAQKKVEKAQKKLREFFEEQCFFGKKLFVCEAFEKVCDDRNVEFSPLEKGRFLGLGGACAILCGNRGILAMRSQEGNEESDARVVV